jgi:hypothetical protein
MADVGIYITESIPDFLNLAKPSLNPLKINSIFSSVINPVGFMASTYDFVNTTGRNLINSGFGFSCCAKEVANIIAATESDKIILFMYFSLPNVKAHSPTPPEMASNSRDTSGGADGAAQPKNPDVGAVECSALLAVPYKGTAVLFNFNNILMIIPSEDKTPACIILLMIPSTQ